MSRVAGLVALAVLLLPRTGSPRIPQPPQIRVATHLVEIHVIVRDKSGPVSNLTKDDFAVLDQGKPQKIGTFSVETSGSGSQPQQSQAEAALHPLPANTFSNLPQYSAPPRSVTIVLLDNLNTLYGSGPASPYEKTPLWVEDLALHNARNHLIEFIQQLPPEDRVAIYGLTHSLHVVCDFTSDRGQLVSILKSYDTQSVTNREIVEPGKILPPVLPEYRALAGGFENGTSMTHAGASNEDRGAETMAALQEIAAHVANIPGRKNLVWLTANLPFSGAEMARILTPANIAVYPVDARGLLGEAPTVNIAAGTADYDAVSGASGHWDNMPAQSSQPIGIATMQKVADETGGHAFVNTNDITGAIRKAVEDSKATYTLGFYIDKGSLDGKFHEIKVEVNHKGLTVLYPKGYFAFPDNAADTKVDQHMLAAAVESPIELSMIPLQASLQRTNEAAHPNVFNLVCSIDAHDIRFTQSDNLRKGAMTVYVIGQNAAGQVLHNWSKTYNLQFTDNQYADLLKSAISFHQGIQLRSEVKTLRIVVEDPATAQTGSLIIPLSRIN